MTTETLTNSERQGRNRNSTMRLLLATAIAILVLLLATVAYFLVVLLNPVGGADGEEPGVTGLVWIRSIYGWGEKQDQQLFRPTDTAIGPDGTVWIAEGQRARVLGFNPNGEQEKLIHFGPAGSSPRALRRPDALDVDEDGNIYIADLLNGKIVVATPDNEIVREWEVPGPLEIAVGGDRVVVGSRYGVGIHDKRGKLIKIIGGAGKGEDQFDGARGIVVDDDGNIFVTEMHNKRLKAYDKDGKLKYVSTLPLRGKASSEASTAGDVQLPAGMTMDGRGRLVYVDPFAFTINVVDPKDGQVIASYGEFGVKDGKFLYPSGISYDAQRDWFAIADANNDRVQIVRIPETAGFAPIAAARRLLASPLAICLLPLILLVIAAIVAVMRRRTRKKKEAVDTPAPEVGAAPAAEAS